MFNPLSTMGLLASPFYKSSLNDCNFITVSNRDKIKQFKKEDGLYGNNQCIMTAQDIQKVLLSEHRTNPLCLDLPCLLLFPYFPE